MPASFVSLFAHSGRRWMPIFWPEFQNDAELTPGIIRPYARCHRLRYRATKGYEGLHKLWLLLGPVLPGQAQRRRVPGGCPPARETGQPARKRKECGEMAAVGVPLGTRVGSGLRVVVYMISHNIALAMAPTEDGSEDGRIIAERRTDPPVRSDRVGRSVYRVARQHTHLRICCVVTSTSVRPATRSWWPRRRAGLRPRYSSHTSLPTIGLRAFGEGRGASLPIFTRQIRSARHQLAAQATPGHPEKTGSAHSGVLGLF